MRYKGDDDTAATGLCKRVRLCRHLGAFDARVLADLVRKQRARLRHYPNNVSLGSQFVKLRHHQTRASVSNGAVKCQGGGSNLLRSGGDPFSGKYVTVAPSALVA